MPANCAIERRQKSKLERQPLPGDGNMSKIHKTMWLHKLPSTPEEVRCSPATDAGFDMLLPCVKQPNGIADYQSKVANVRTEYSDWDPLMVLAEEANRVGLKIHAWCCVFPEGDDSKLLAEHPEFAAVAGEEQPKTEGFRLGCPNRPEVQDYEAAIYQELIDNYPIAGVHLDYIRFTGGLCWCDYCKADYRSATGGDLDNLGFFKWRNKDAQDMGQWIRWRCDVITRFVRRIRKASADGGKELSAAVFHYHPGVAGYWTGLGDLVPRRLARLCVSHELLGEHSDRGKVDTQQRRGLERSKRLPPMGGNPAAGEYEHATVY